MAEDNTSPPGEILRDVRDEVRQTNARGEHIESGFDEILRQLTEAEIRTTAAFATVNGLLLDIKTMLSDRLEIRDRVVRCEHEIEVLKAKVG
jgi:hypothetical protein